MGKAKEYEREVRSLTVHRNKAEASCHVSHACRVKKCVKLRGENQPGPVKIELGQLKV